MTLNAGARTDEAEYADQDQAQAESGSESESESESGSNAASSNVANQKGSSKTKKKPSFTKKQILEGKIVDARFDSVTGKIVLQVKTEKYCNAISPSLKATKSGRATFGPFHFNLDFGLTDMKACIPKEERIREIAIDAPELNTKQGFYIATIHGENGTVESVKVDLNSVAGSEGQVQEEQTYAAEENSNVTTDLGQPVTYEQLQDFAGGEDQAAAGAAR
jgi:hypothetical protein